MSWSLNVTVDWELRDDIQQACRDIWPQVEFDVIDI
ncbi:hypothetical protein [Alteromonadales bacterium alter-6D02]